MNESEKLLSSTKESELYLNSPDPANNINKKIPEFHQENGFVFDHSIDACGPELNKEAGQEIFVGAMQQEAPHNPGAKKTEFGDFLKHYGVDLKQKGRQKGGRRWSIHKDMEIPLGDLYRNQELTIISEEFSKAFLDINSYVKREEIPSNLKKNESLHLNSKFKINDNSGFDFNSVNREFSLKSVDTCGQAPKFDIFGSEFPESESKLASISLEELLKKRTKRRTQSEVQGIHSPVAGFERAPKPKAESEVRIKNYEWDKLFKTSLTYTSNKIVEKSHKQLKSPMRFSRYNYKKQKHNLIKKFSKSEVLQKKKIMAKKKTEKYLEIVIQMPRKPQYSINVQGLDQTIVGFSRSPATQAVIFKLKSGLFYEGKLKSGRMEGHGKLWKKIKRGEGQNLAGQARVLIYEGEFTGGNMQGTGSLYFENRWRYEGSFKQNVAHGFGRLLDNFGILKKEGLWMNGVFRG